MYKFSVVRFCNGVIFIVKFHLTQIHYVVFAANEQVYLSTLRIVIASKAQEDWLDDTSRMLIACFI